MASPIESYARPLSLCLALLCAAGAARAEGPSDADRKLAQSLFDHARQMLEAGRVAEACPKFAESQRLDPGGGTLLNLALCHEREGKTASAWFEYNDALSLALKESRHDREQIARERLAALEPKLSRLAVAPAPGAEIAGLEVRLDGTVLRRAAWGTPAVVDPGPHGVDARAPGRLPWSSSVTVEGEGQVKQVEVPALAPVPAPTPPPPPRYDEVTVKQRSKLFYALVATAGGGLGLGALAGLSALGKQDEAEKLCKPERQYCPQEGIEARDAARSLAWVSTVAFGVGLAAAAALPFVPPAYARKRVRVGAGAGPGGFTLGVGGAF